MVAGFVTLDIIPAVGLPVKAAAEKAGAGIPVAWLSC